VFTDPDLTQNLVQQADTVFHLAAAVGVRLIVDHPIESLLTNIRGTENVLEAAEGSGTKVVITSSSEIYGKSEKLPFREDDDRLLGPPQKLRWSYSTSKAVDEILAYAYYRDRGLPTVVARLFNTVGPRQTGRYGMVLPRLIGQAQRGERLTIYGDGTQSRVFAYVGDVVEALARLAQARGAEGEAFNVAGTEEISINALAQRILERTGSPSTTMHIPFEDVYGEGFEDPGRRVADTTKLEQVTGYRCETPIDLVIERMLEHQPVAAPR
jgi:UDP-glucose 4-epimerase